MTYRFIPNVRFFRENWKWFRPNRPCVYIIMGYGSINKSLFERNCIQTADCPGCPNEEESVEHMLFYCSLYKDSRGDINDLAVNDDWTVFLQDEAAFTTFSNYVSEVFSIRKDFIQNV